MDPRKRRYFEYDPSDQAHSNGDQEGDGGSKRNRHHEGGDLGGRLPWDLKEYIRSVADGIATLEKDSIEMNTLVSKCFDECKGHETSLCCDPDTSRHVESICESSVSNCLQFVNRFMMNKRKSIVQAVGKRVGSRCVESILYLMRDYLSNSKKAEDHNAICAILIQFGEMLLEEFDTVVASLASTHILRAFGRICCGLGRPDRHQDGRKRKDNDDSELRTNLLSRSELKSSFTGIAGRVLDWRSMCDYYHQESISCLVQEYLQLESLASNEIGRNGTRNLVVAAFNEENEQTVIDHWTKKQASRVWESIIEHCDDHLAIDRLYRTCLVGKLAECSMHPFANFPLQRLLERCSGKQLANDMVDELLPIFQELWTAKRYGVLIAIASACERNRARQKEYKKDLRIATGCDRPKSRRQQQLVAILQFSTFDDLSAANEKDDELPLIKDNITIHGSAIVQHLLRFRKPDVMVDGLLKLNIASVMDLACHASGSRVIDAFFTSETIAEEKKASLFKILTNRNVVVSLACDRYGSRIVENLWSRADTKEKYTMAEHLTNDKAMTTLSRSQYGRIIWTKYRLERYKISPKEWRTFMDTVDSKKRMLEDLLK